jgi:hypothetical protein
MPLACKIAQVRMPDLQSTACNLRMQAMHHIMPSSTDINHRNDDTHSSCITARLDVQLCASIDALKALLHDKCGPMATSHLCCKWSQLTADGQSNLAYSSNMSLQQTKHGAVDIKNKLCWNKPQRYIINHRTLPRLG